MRVLVTGAAGRLGRWVARTVLDDGHEVVAVDRRPPEHGVTPALDGAELRAADLLDRGQVADAVDGCDGVVHLGAIPAPRRHPNEEVFRNNTGATYTVLEAAARAGVGRAVIASSVSALGMAWADEPFPPLYAPIDEQHPLLPRDPYGLSKECDERTGEMFHRRTGMTVLAHRFHWIGQPGEAAARAGADDQPSRGLWGYVDVRDAADACLLGMRADGLGFEAFNITAADTLSDTPTEELLRRHFPDLPRRRPIPGTASAWSIDKAGELLGYVPRFGWRGQGREAG